MIPKYLDCSEIAQLLLHARMIAESASLWAKAAAFIEVYKFQKVLYKSNPMA
jgi:hypothetical protein